MNSYKKDDDWGDIFEWAKPPDASSAQSDENWGQIFEWANPPQPEPEPQPSTWDNIKTTAGNVKDTVTSPAFWDKVGDVNDKIGEAVQAPLKWAGRNLQAGMGDYSNAFYKTLQSVGGDKVPGVNKVLDSAVEGTEQWQAQGGTDIGSQVVRSLPGAAMNMGLALMSGGASTAGQIPAMGSEAIRQTAMQTLKSPTFINSAMRSYGGAYGEAMDAGASRLQGISAGVQQALPQAMIEQAGGLEQIPNRAGEGVLKTIGRSALEEGMEEVAQYPFEGLAKKATYAPETPIFSMQEQAVINPVQQAQAGLVGGLAGGLLGGAGRVFNNTYNVLGQSDVQSDVQAEPYSPPTNNVFYGDQYGNVTQDQNFRPFLQLPPGPDFQAQQAVDARPQADFYTDPYGVTSTEPDSMPLQLPAPNQRAQTDPEIVSKFSELDSINSRIGEIENDITAYLDGGHSADTQQRAKSTADFTPIGGDAMQPKGAPLNSRVTGDTLLDAQDLISEVQSYGGAVDDNGYVKVYHRTDKPNADNIINTGKMKAAEDGLFFSTKPDGQIEGYGDTVIELNIPAERLSIDDVFDNEVHLRLPIKNRNSVTDVKDFLSIPQNQNELTPIGNTAETTPYVSTEATAQDTSASELENLKSQRDKLQSELQGEKYQAVDERFSAIDGLDKNSLNELMADAESITESLINEHIEFLKMTSGLGVEQGGLIYHDDGSGIRGEVTGRFGRTSNNEKWYQDWARENSYKKLTNKDLRDIAIKHLTEGVDTYTAGYIEPNQAFMYGRDLIDYAKMKSNLIDDAPYIANRNIEAPSRVMPGELESLNQQGINPNVQRQSDALSMLNPPIADPGYQSATGQIETPMRVFPGERITPLEEMLPNREITSLENMIHPISSQETIRDVQDFTQPNTQARVETATTVEPDTFTVETNERTRTYDSKKFVDNKGRTLETYINEDPVYRELSEQLEQTSSQPDTYIQNNATDIKDKSGFAHNMDNPQRGLEKVFGKHWDYVKKNYFDTFDKSKGDYSREVTARADKIYEDVVQKYGIKKGSKESAAIQWYGEGERIKGSDRNFASKLLNPEYETITDDAGQKIRVPKMEKYTLKDLKRDFPNKWQDIVESEKIFRQQYDEMIDLINESRKKVYPSVEKQVAETEQRIKDLNSDIVEYKNRLENKNLAQNEIKEINRKINEMSKKSGELSDKLKSGELWRNKRLPKRKNYFRHFKEMNSGVVGLFNIIESPSQISSNLAGISEFTKPKSKWASFMQQRGLGDYTADAVGGFIDYLRPASHAVHIDPHITKFRQLAKDVADGTQTTRNANNLVLFLNDYANSLAGKTNKFDRLVQDMIPGGRKTFAIINWFNSRARANAVLGNLRSSITQVANMPAGISEVNDPVALSKGMGETMANIIGKGNKAIEQSDFITERYMDSVFDKFDTKLTSKPKQFAAWLLGVGDEFGTRFTWNSAYQKALKNGEANPMKYADDLTRNVVAGRGVGEVPLMQQSKLFQTFFPFQLEVGNIAHVMAKQVKGKEFGKLMTLLVGNFLFNGIAESLYGDRPLPDPIDAMMDALSEEDASIGTVAGRLGGEVLSNVPMGQTVASLWPEYETDVTSPLGEYSIPSRQQLFGDNDPTRFGSGFLLQEAVKDPFYKLALPWGGSQLKKTVGGAEALNEGGYIKDDKLRFLTPPTTENVIKSLAFGRNATPEAREYFDKDRRPLSEKQTQQVMSASDPKAEFERIHQQRQINKLQQEIKDVAKNRDLSMGERDKRIMELRLQIEQLRATR